MYPRGIPKKKYCCNFKNRCCFLGLKNGCSTARRGEAGRTEGEALPAGRPAAGTAPCPERHLATGWQEPPGKRRARDRDGASGPAPHKGTEVIHANCTDQRKQNLRKNPHPENLPSGLPEGSTKPRGSALTGPRTGQRAGPGPQHRCERGGSGQCAAVSRQNRHGPQPLPHCQHPTVKPKLHREHVCTPRRTTRGKLQVSSPEKGWARGTVCHRLLGLEAASLGSSRRGKGGAYTWTRSQALKLLERHAILNQRCETGWNTRHKS